MNYPLRDERLERWVLGSICIEKNAFYKATAIIDEEDFTTDMHKNIYVVLGILIEGQEQIDYVVLVDQMKRAGMKVGASYIATMIDDIPTAANIEYYCRLLRDMSKRRMIQDILAQSRDMALEDVEEKVERIFKRKERKKTESIKETMESIEHPEEKIIYSQYLQIDRFVGGFRAGNLIIVGGRPSVGKSSLALNIACNIAKTNRRVGFFSLETAARAVNMRMMASEGQILLGNLRNPKSLTDIGMDKTRQIAEKIMSYKFYLNDHSKQLGAIISAMGEMKKEKDIDIVFIDYINLIQIRKSMQSWERIALISSRLKAAAMNLKIPIVALSQLNREAENKIPTLANLREGGALEQDADVVIFLHRKREDNPEKVEVRIAKNRDGETNNFMMTFQPEYTRFETSGEYD
jgi:replicative DNA helicase